MSSVSVSLSICGMTIEFIIIEYNTIAQFLDMTRMLFLKNFRSLHEANTDY
jgi:hypothetical protein